MFCAQQQGCCSWVALILPHRKDKILILDEDSRGHPLPQRHDRARSAATPVPTKMERYQGVLWKRRDVFKNRWRPRWFVLQPGQGVLTYYLLTSPVQDPTTSPAGHEVPTGTPEQPPVQRAPRTEPVLRRRDEVGTTVPRNRTTSWDSAVSENSVDYDVVPRGTIYLMGSTVGINDGLSRPRENLYAFTIHPPNATEPLVHLAARSVEARSMWVEKIAQVSGLPPNPALEESAEERGTSLGLLDPLLTMNHNFYHQTILEETQDALEEDIHEDGGLQNDEAELDDQQPSHAQEKWECCSPASEVFANVPEHLTARLQEKLASYLELCDEDTSDVRQGWKKLFQRDGMEAYQRLDGNRPDDRVLVKTTMVLKHPPKQIFNLLIDFTQRQEFEPNIRYHDRMKICNPFVFLDYIAYHPVWPTKAREFAVVVHWQVVSKGQEKAVATLAFSCPEAEAIRPVAANHVRGDLIVSMYLLRAVPENPDECRLSRLASFDLGGGLSRKLSDFILTRQAGMPHVIAEYLAKHDSVPPNRLRGPLSNKALIEDVIHEVGAEDSRVRRRLTFATEGETLASNGPDDSVDHLLSSPAVETQAILLLGPVILYRLLVLFSVPGAFLSFCLFSFLGIRQVVLLHIGELLVPDNEDRSVIGPITCRFSVDLKGALRYIANRREEREEMRDESAEISIVHILAVSLAKALKKERALQRRRICYPWLWIDGIVDGPLHSIDVSVSENAGGFVTLHGVEKRSIQSIADELANTDNVHGRERSIGQCLVMASRNSEDGDIETDAFPIDPRVTIVAVVGGVRLDRNSPRSPGASSIISPRPLLSISISIVDHHQSDLDTCRRFSEEVRKLVQYPEMCDG